MTEEKLEQLRNTYLELLNETEPKILLEDKTISDANKQQLSLEMDWGSLYSQVYGYLMMLDNELEEVYSNAYTKIVNDSYKSYTATEAKQIAMSNHEYVNTKKQYNKLKKLEMDVRVIKDTVNSRRYLLKHITDSAISGVSDEWL